MPEADVMIRKADSSDADVVHSAILKMGRAIGGFDKIRSTPDDLRRFGFGERPGFEGLIAEVGGQFAGMCLFFPSFSTWLGRPGVYVQDVHVDEAFRGRQIGRGLIREVAAIAARRGAVYLRLSVDAANTGAHRFYEKIGLEWSSDERIYAAYGARFRELGENEAVTVAGT